MGELSEHLPIWIITICFFFGWLIHCSVGQGSFLFYYCGTRDMDMHRTLQNNRARMKVSTKTILVVQDKWGGCRPWSHGIVLTFFL